MNDGWVSKKMRYVNKEMLNFFLTRLVVAKYQDRVLIGL
jgi:hypothetical protein